MIYLDSLEKGDEFSYDWFVALFDTEKGRLLGRPARMGLAQRLSEAGLSPIAKDSFPLGWLGDSVVFWSDERFLRLPLSGETSQPTGPAAILLDDLDTYELQVGRSLMGDPIAVHSAGLRSTNIWELRLDTDHGSGTGELTQTTHDTGVSAGWSQSGGGLALSADGRLLVFPSNRTGTPDLWMRDLSNGEERLLTPPSSVDTDAALTSDGHFLAFQAVQERKSAIQVLDMRTRAARLLCRNCGAPTDWSPGGQTLLSIRGNQLLAVNRSSGEAITLFDSPDLWLGHASFHPGGRHLGITVARKHEALLRGLVVPFQGKLEKELDRTPVVVEPWMLSLRFSPNGNLVYYFATSDGFRCLWARPLDPVSRQPLGAPFAIRHFHHHQPSPRRGSRFMVARDKIVLTLFSASSNIWLVRLRDTQDMAVRQPGILGFLRRYAPWQ